MVSCIDAEYLCSLGIDGIDAFFSFMACCCVINSLTSSSNLDFLSVSLLLDIRKPFFLTIERILSKLLANFESSPTS